MERRILEFEGLEYIGFDLSMASGRPLILGDRRDAVMLWAFLRTLSVNTFLIAKAYSLLSIDFVRSIGSGDGYLRKKEIFLTKRTDT